MAEPTQSGRRVDGRPFKDGNTREDGSYDVGKNRTPENTRFASGDGRKRGRRPKGQKNFDTDWEEELTKSVVIVENGKRKRTTAHRAQVKRTMERGGKGDHRAQQTIYQRADRLRERKETRSSLSDSELIGAWLVHQQMGGLAESSVMTPTRILLKRLPTQAWKMAMVRVRPSVAVSDEEVLPALLRQSFALFFRFAFREVSGGELQWNFHIDAMIHQLERLRRGENRKRVIPIPPRHLKSVTMTAWVAWMLGNDPSLKFICASYGYDLAEKHARDCLKIMSAPWYREAFARLTIEKKAILNLTTSQSGYRLSTSVGGVVTGLGADYVIIDDPMKADDAHSEAERKRVIDWFDNALPFRLESLERSAFVVIMQRLHEDDLAGNLLSRGGWHELRLPAIATADELIEVGPGRFYQRREGHALHPARQSLAILTQLKAENAMSFAAQQQQDPVPATGNYVDPAWFPYYDDPPERGLVVQSWDTASKTGLSNDYSVGITARYFNRRYYVLDVCRQRMDFATLRRRVDHLCAHYGVGRLLIEDASSGQQLIQIMRAAPGRSPRPIACKPDDDKVVRFHAQASKIEGGEVVLPKSAPWLADFIKEICAFPNGRYKDQADALGQLLKFGARRWTDEDTSVAAPIFF